ncbi:LPXTG-motif cell wall anchor domain protein [Streptococcus mitis]|uniref:LPXTG-motif cell wall anchor domain protein n=1 Tax=Streptococcus mitis TaxID=28037 RepID=A0A081PWV8_STRMT|nr:Ig-like domain-containing protein [Streptococcus mitis]KEQ35181.1 LPXTG-motif cell wall anchor domain protein [Streptococcus mitis]
MKAEAGSTVSLFAHDGTKLGTAVANDQGVASITPTVNIPAGIVAATATKNGKTSEVSAAVEATPAADAATNNPTPGAATNNPSAGAATNNPATDAATSGPEIVNDLEGKASTPADVTVKAPAGSTVKLYNTDGVVIGEAVANAQGVATVHPTNSLPAGEITATSTPAGGTESAKSAPITVTASPVTVKDGGVTGNNDTRLLVSKSEITVYPGDNIDIDVVAQATALEKFSVEKNPIAIKGVVPSGGYLGSSNGATIRQRDAKYSGTVAMDQPAGTTEVVFHAKNRDKPTTIYRALIVNVLETAKKYEPVAGTKVDIADSNGVSETEKNKIIEAVKTANPSLPADSQYSVDEKGNLTITYPDGSKDKIAATYLVNPPAPAAPAAPTTPAVAPTVEIPYSDKSTKEVYVYGGEENSFDIKFKDDSGKIASATVKQGGNRAFADVAGEANTINTQYGFKANVINAETPATADTPAVITYSGTPAATDGLKQEALDAATKGENPSGMALGWRYATATDTDGAFIENKAVGSSTATDPGAFRVMLKGQTQKYDIATPTEKVVVADPANVTDADLAKIKEKLQLEYSQTNDDANLADKKGTAVADKDAKIESVTKDDKGNLVVTYKDGSVDKKPLSEFVRTNEKPTVEIQYSDPAPNKKEVYVYASEVNSFDIKIKDDSGKLASAELRRGSNQSFQDVAGETNKQNTEYGFTANKFTTETTATAENPAVITYTGTPAPEGKFTKEKFEAAIQNGGTPLGWRFVKAIDKDGADARGNGRDATDPTAVNVILKPQTQKYDIKTPAEADKVVVSDVNNVTDKEFEKIKEKVKLEYSQNNPDARLADKKGSLVDAQEQPSRIQSITRDADDNVVVTYADGSKDKKPLSEFVTKKPTDADKNTPTAKPQTVNKGTTPKAEDSIGNVKDLPKGTKVAFKAPVDTATPGEKDATVVVTYPDGSKEEVPVKVTVKAPSSTPDTKAPAKPEIKTDLTDKAGTKTPVEVSAEPGSKVELFDKDGNKIGEGVAGKDGKATITPTVELPAGDVIAKATDPAGNVSQPSAPEKATADTKAPSKPEINTDLTDKAGTKTPVEVSAEPGSKVELFDKDGHKLGEGVAGKDGKATITPTVELPAGDVTAKATDPAGNVSQPSTPEEATADTKAPAKPEIKTDLTDKAGTKTPVEVSAEPGSKVELFDKDGHKIGEGVAGKDGKATITPTVELPAGDVTAKATDPAGNVSEPSTPEKATADTKAPSKPEINTDLTDKAGTKTPVEVSAEPGSKVELFDKDGNKIGEGVAGKDGKATITPTVELPAGDVTAKATDPEGNVSEPSTPEKATADTKAPSKPEINTDLTDKAGTKTPVEVSAEPGSKVELFDKDGHKLGEGVAGKDGKATITPTKELPAGDVTAKATDPAGNVSEPSVPATATKDTKAPAKPEVKTDLTDKAGTKTPVEVTAEPGSKVELFDKDGHKLGEGVADENGKATITPTKELPAGDVTAKATDPAGNVSEPSVPATATKDTKAPAKPEVKTDLTDKAGTKTPVEVSAEPGSKVELFDKDGHKLGEGVADENGKATITPTKELPAGDVTAKATDPAGNVSEPSVPATATKDNAVKDPAVTPVVDPSNLTEAEKAKVADEVKKSNPTVTDVKVGKDGTTTVTFPDGTTAVIPSGDTVKKSSDNAVKDPAVTPVVDPSNLTEAEKAKVADEVKKSNPTVTDVKVGKDGTTTVTFPDGTTAVIPSGDTVKKSSDNAVKDPAVTPVVDPSNLTEAEKAKVADEVKKSNPTVTDVKVGKDGTTTVTFPDGTTAVIPSGDTVKKSSDNAVKDPAVTPVVDPSNLTEADKAKVAEAVKKSNPTVTDVKVGKDGTTTVTFPDGSTAVIPSGDTVKKSSDNAVKDPAVTPVVDPSNLTEADKAKVAEAVKKSNPTVTDVKVGKDGTTTVTFPDGSTAVIPSGDTVKKSSDNAVKDPAVTPVVDPSNLTEADKAKVAEAVKKSNPTVTDVKVGKDGTTTVTFPDGTTAVIPSGDTVKKSNPTATDVNVGKGGTTAVIPANKADDKSKDADGVKDPSVTLVVDPSNLTDAEKAKVAEAVKKSNPTATDVKVGKDGTTTVTFPDGTTAVISADKAVTSAEQGSHGVAPAGKAVTSAEQGSNAATPAKKAGAKELPNTGTEQSSASLALALLAAATGGLLIAKKREEEE